jgi:energy-coupling factor transporter ATP-binding protein EcfA2
MYRDNYITALRQEMLELVQDRLSPVALRYGYSETPLEANIKWRPQVLFLGNYSSGKSTLINELLGVPIQATGQAPTDDCFTVITYDEVPGPVHVTEERDGRFLLNDPEYPFESLKRHGQRFAAHFRLKKVNSPFLKQMALIDTPGMLDSVAERDRGYNYQQVIGDLAHIADLVLMLFDPHNPGTVREVYSSLRETLPAHTFEDRIIFVLNRIDACTSLNDLLRVYGTLCWNLSQMTGRKDIPPIRLTYSPRAAEGAEDGPARRRPYLQYLENQREELRRAIQEAPRYRLDHLAAFIETHADRLSLMLGALVGYRRRLRAFRLRSLVRALVYSLSAGALVVGLLTLFGVPVIGDPLMAGTVGGTATLLTAVAWGAGFHRFLFKRFQRQALATLDQLVSLESQTRRDTWQAVRPMVVDFIRRTGGRFSLGQARQDVERIGYVATEGAREIRTALNELAGMRPEGPPLIPPPPPEGGSVLPLKKASREPG